MLPRNEWVLRLDKPRERPDETESSSRGVSLSGNSPPLIAPLQLAHFLGKGNLLPGLVILLSALGRWRGIGIGSFPFPGSSMLSLVGGLVREGVQV